MKLAIVTACPNGKISSVLSARLLDAAAQRQGWSTSVEIHDPRHPEKQLSPGEIEAADWVLVVCGYDRRALEAASDTDLADAALLRHGAATSPVRGLYALACTATPTDVT